MSSLDDEDRFGPVGAPQLTAFGLGLSALLAMIGFVKARVHSRHCTGGYNACRWCGRGLEMLIRAEPCCKGPPTVSNPRFSNGDGPDKRSAQLGAGNGGNRSPSYGLARGDRNVTFVDCQPWCGQRLTVRQIDRSACKKNLHPLSGGNSSPHARAS